MGGWFFFFFVGTDIYLQAGSNSPVVVSSFLRDIAYRAMFVFLSFQEAFVSLKAAWG